MGDEARVSGCSEGTGVGTTWSRSCQIWPMLDHDECDVDRLRPALGHISSGLWKVRGVRPILLSPVLGRAALGGLCAVLRGQSRGGPLCHPYRGECEDQAGANRQVALIVAATGLPEFGPISGILPSKLVKPNHDSRSFGLTSPRFGRRQEGGREVQDWSEAGRELQILSKVARTQPLGVISHVRPAEFSRTWSIGLKLGSTSTSVGRIPNDIRRNLTEHAEIGRTRPQFCKRRTTFGRSGPRGGRSRANFCRTWSGLGRLRHTFVDFDRPHRQFPPDQFGTSLR